MNRNCDINNRIKRTERDIQKQKEECKIETSRFKFRYKVIKANARRPKYLIDNKQGNGLNLIAKIRYGNFEDYRKYWLDVEKRKCKFCSIGWDRLEHYVKDCEITNGWFIELGDTERERLLKLTDCSNGEVKVRIINKVWKEKKKL